jgi:single-strand DNA-binding protein
MLNRIILIGRLTKDPELRTTNSGKSVASFRIAVDRTSGPDKETDFFSVTCWERQAEFVSNYLSKGRLVAVDGRLQTRTWTGQDGVERRDVEIVAGTVQGLDKPKDQEGGDTRANQPTNEDDPFAED